MFSQGTQVTNAVLDAISARHSVRQFTGQAVAEADLEALLNAANRAPSAHNQQAWRFIIVRGGKKRELADLVASRLGQFPKPAAALLRMAGRAIANAPVVVAVTNTGELIASGTRLFQINSDVGRDFFRTMEIQSSAAAVENLLIAATSLNLAAVWLGILYLLKDDVRALLGEPEGEFMAVVPVGYPARAAQGPAKRPVSAIARLLD